MIRLPSATLGAETAARLSGYQDEVRAVPAFAEQVHEGKRLFALRNTTANPVFNEVRARLTEMCSGAMRCVYCEDSARDQVEHIAPKDWYPERVFDWENYVYACGRCNLPKSNKFAIFSHWSGARVNLSRSKNDPILPPVPGDPLLINPRLEDPLSFLWLDLSATFYFVPLPSGLNRSLERANYTIELLRLNSRDELPVARAQAYGIIAPGCMSMPFRSRRIAPLSN